MTGGDPPPFVNSMMLTDLLTDRKVEILTDYRLDSIDANGVNVCACAGGATRSIEADSVIIAIGFRPTTSVAAELYGTGIEIYQVGDANKVGSIRTAVRDAYEIAQGL